MNPTEILEKYWGYSQFRPKQNEIISSVLSGKDTLALLPTGGGKSICFQVPALCMEGICIVVSPLIALMRDQVENLKRRNIKAVCITSGMRYTEIDIILDNCVYGDYRFLYLSPERLKSDIVIERIRKMKVSLFAIDEAHCISQWGYDFRPAYLEIAATRELHPHVPVIALTATATPPVVKDIQKHLRFKKTNAISGSFARANIAYNITHDSDKLNLIFSRLSKTGASAIIYCRSRKATVSISDILNKAGVSADYYHGGLDPKTRTEKQTDWLQNKTQVMVCTNAFGMGIDKPDVRLVFHLDLPDSPEAYFQEAGRAGRDGQPAEALLIYTGKDIEMLHTHVESAFPPLPTIRALYNGICNHYQLAVGSGKGMTYSFDLGQFASTYNTPVVTVFSAIRILDREGYLSLNEEGEFQSRVMIIANTNTIYDLQVRSREADDFIKLLLRSYTGLYDEFVPINEFELAKRLRKPVEKIIGYLRRLDQLEILRYSPKSAGMRLTFTEERIDDKNLRISHENYQFLKERAKERADTMIRIAQNRVLCRSRMLLDYFGESSADNCQRCDICLQQPESTISEQGKILNALHTPLSPDALRKQLSEISKDNLAKSIQEMLEAKLIHYQPNGLLTLNENQTDITNGE